MFGPVLEVFFALVVAGLVGGIGSAFLQNFMTTVELAEKRTRVKCDYLILWKSIALGIVASFVVPVFLEIAAIGNDKSVLNSILTENDSSKRWNGLFLLLSFCTLAAVTAQRFLTKMEEQILNKVEKAAAKAESAEARGNIAIGDAQRALAKAEDAEEMAEAISEPQFVIAGVSEESDLLLKAIFNSPSKAPTTFDLLKALGLDSNRLDEMIDESRDAGLIRETYEDDGVGVRWIFRGWGKRRILRLIPPNAIDKDVLKAITTLNAEKRMRRPKPKDIADNIKKPIEEVEASLIRLQKYGFVAESKSEANGWRIRSWGRQELKG